MQAKPKPKPKPQRVFQDAEARRGLRLATLGTAQLCQLSGDEAEGPPSQSQAAPLLQEDMCELCELCSNSPHQLFWPFSHGFFWRAPRGYPSVLLWVSLHCFEVVFGRALGSRSGQCPEAWLVKLLGFAGSCFCKPGALPTWDCWHCGPAFLVSARSTIWHSGCLLPATRQYNVFDRYHKTARWLSYGRADCCLTASLPHVARSLLMLEPRAARSSLPSTGCALDAAGHG